MNRERLQRPGVNFQIVCIWCGAKIRNDEREDASGLCLKCFYQLLSERLQTHKTSNSGEFNSER